MVRTRFYRFNWSSISALIKRLTSRKGWNSKTDIKCTFNMRLDGVKNRLACSESWTWSKLWPKRYLQIPEGKLRFFLYLFQNLLVNWMLVYDRAKMKFALFADLYFFSYCFHEFLISPTITHIIGSYIKHCIYFLVSSSAFVKIKIDIWSNSIMILCQYGISFSLSRRFVSNIIFIINQIKNEHNIRCQTSVLSSVIYVRRSSTQTATSPPFGRRSLPVHRPAFLDPLQFIGFRLQSCIHNSRWGLREIVLAGRG